MDRPTTHRATRRLAQPWPRPEPPARDYPRSRSESPSKGPHKGRYVLLGASGHSSQLAPPSPNGALQAATTPLAAQSLAPPPAGSQRHGRRREHRREGKPSLRATAGYAETPSAQSTRAPRRRLQNDAPAARSDVRRSDYMEARTPAGESRTAQALRSRRRATPRSRRC